MRDPLTKRRTPRDPIMKRSTTGRSSAGPARQGARATVPALCFLAMIAAGVLSALGAPVAEPGQTSKPNGAPGPGSADAGAQAMVQGEILFEIRSDAFNSGAFRAELLSRGRTGLSAVDAVLARLAVSTIRNVFNPARNAGRKHEMGMDRIFVARYAGVQGPREAAAALAGAPGVDWAEPDHVISAATTPNDPLYYYQWADNNHGQAIAVDGDSVGTYDADGDMNQAWNLQTGNYNVVIAIIDSGIDRGHPEFANRVLSGWDFVNNDSDPNDDVGHGTACAGIAAARGNNGQGVAGVAWEDAILPVKVLNSSNQGTNANIAAGIEYAADFGAKVLSMSFAGGADTTLHLAVDYAHSADCVEVAAAGNANTSPVAYPAGYVHVIAVGALSPCNDRKTPSTCDGETNWGSNYGVGLDLMAPGTRIHTTDIQGAGGYNAGDYTPTFNGTSAATPFVAGIAALVRSENINLTADDVSSTLRASCDDLGAQGWDQDTGWGRINAYVALRSVSGAVFVGPNNGVQQGTYYLPYASVADGIYLVPSGNCVVIKPGSYDEAVPFHINKVVRLDAIDGNVHIH